MSKRNLAKNAGSMSLAVFISRILGLMRDIVMTSFFGTSYVADAFQVAYQIPNLLRKLFGEGALSAAFVPIYNEVGIEKGRKYQVSFAINVLSLLSLALLILCGLGILLAPLIVRVLAPGFNEQTYLLTLKLTRIMFPYLFFIGLSSTLISILNSHDYFFLPGLTSAFLNIGMVGSLALYIFLNDAQTLEQQVTVWSYGVVIGGVLQTIVNFPLLKRLGYRVQLKFSLAADGLKAVWQRFLPGVWGLAIRQVNLAVDLILASTLATGSIAALNYGNRLMQLPLGIFGITAGVVALPAFSRYFAQKKWETLADELRFSIISLSLIMLPVTAILAGLGKDIIRVIFMRGAFGEHSLNMTNAALIFYSIGLVFYGLNRLIIPIYYANKDTKTPVQISAFIVVINISLNIIFMKFLQHAGLALATSVSAVIHFAVLLMFIRKKIPQIHIPSMKRSILKILLLSLLIFAFLSLVNYYYLAANFWQALLKIAILGIMSLIILVTGINILKIERGDVIIKRIWQKILRR
jgi:putative peptidoglycan lipid II flippase